MSDLFSDHKDELPDEWHDTFDQLTAQGKSPSGIKAAIEYATTDKTQDEISDEFNVSGPTIRSLTTAVVAIGPIDSAKDSGRSGMTKMNYCNYLADRYGWEEGDEYSVSKSYTGDTPSPSLNKGGWQDIYREVFGGDESE